MGGLVVGCLKTGSVLRYSTGYGRPLRPARRWGIALDSCANCTYLVYPSRKPDTPKVGPVASESPAEPYRGGA